MKRILSAILALVVCLSFSVTSFAAVSNVFNFYDQSTGTNYFFARFENSDEEVGFQIKGKEYVLDELAYEKAKSVGNLFGIGIRDEKGVLGENYIATPYTYTDGVKTLQSESEVIGINYEYNRNMLETLTVKGEEINAFSPYKTWYYYVLDEGETLSVSDIEATPLMTLSKSVVAESENGFVITTSSDFAEPSTVEIITVKKGEYQENQSAPIVGWKNMNLYYPKLEDGNFAEEAIVTVNLLKGGTQIYDGDELRMKAPFTQAVAQMGELNPYGMALIQFDISGITNINDRVILNVPAWLNGTSYAGEIGFIGVDNEAPILKEKYYTGSAAEGTGSGSDAYNAALENLIANPTVYMQNAISMINLDKADYEIAPRAQVTFQENAANVKTIKSVDVTDYVRSKVLAGEDTVTFALRAFHNAALSGSMDKEAQVSVSTKDSALVFTDYEGEVALADIKVDGVSLTDFDKDTLNYGLIVARDSSLPVVSATAADEENLSVTVTQATEIPGAATIKVKAKTGKSVTYTVNFDYPFERGTFTKANAYRMERTPGTVNFTKFVSDVTNSETFSGRVYNAKGDPREEALIKFTTTAKGLNEDDKLILTVAARAEEICGVGGFVRIVGIVDENYVYNTTLPVVDRNYTYTSTDTLTTDFKQFSFDVTSYVKSRLLNGCNQVSFLVELVDPDWKKGDGRNGGDSVYMPLIINAPYDLLPTLEYKDTALTELSYDGNAIEIVEGQNDYVVALEDGSAVPFVTAAAEGGYSVTVNQATEFPGVAEVIVNQNGLDSVYTVRFTTVKTEGAASLLAGYSATRETVYHSLDSNAAALDINSESKPNYQIRTMDNGWLRQEATFKFDLDNIYGLDVDKKVKLTVYGFGNATSLSNDVKLVVRSTTGEGIAVGKKYGTNVDTEIKLAIDPEATMSSIAAHTFDVTELVKAKIAAGETTASFTVRIEEGVGAAYFYLYYAGEYQPTLVIE